MQIPRRNEVSCAKQDRTGHAIARRLVAAALVGCVLVPEEAFADPAEQVKIGTGATIVKLRSLLAPRDAAAGVQVEGIERTGATADGRMDAHVLYVHGMGWAENAGVLGDSWHLVRAVEGAYGVSGSVMNMSRMCADGSHVGPVPAKGGLHLGPPLQALSTDDPRVPVSVGAIACMDRVEVKLDEKQSVTLYRLLWDNLLYDAVLYPHIGYDDDIFGAYETAQVVPSTGPTPSEGYEDLHALRAAVTASVKNNLSSYGLSEAALYLGPLGNDMRKTVSAAICIVADEAEGVGQHFSRLAELHNSTSSRDEAYIWVDINSACQRPTKAPGNARFSIVTESLGSRVVFDTFALDPDERLAKRPLQGPDDAGPEVFMLANQIPVLAPGVLHGSNARPADRVRSRFVAFSEVNDVLSYELVPYFEHLYNMRCRPQPPSMPVDKACPSSTSTPVQMAEHRALLRDVTARRSWSRELGFEAVDVRTKFAKPSLLSGTVDPVEAHGGYLDQRDLVRLMLCGVKDGHVRNATDGCSSN